MYGINSEPPKNCLNCPLCQGEYGKGNEKSYCAIKSEVKLKYNGSRPKECPIIADPLPQWQIEFLSALIKDVRQQGEWEVFYTPKMKKVFRCNKCQAVSIQGKTKFCYNCGISMKEGAE